MQHLNNRMEVEHLNKSTVFPLDPFDEIKETAVDHIWHFFNHVVL